MPNPTWPASLPQNLEITGLQESPPNLTIRTPMEVGPPKLRRRATAGVRPIQGRQLLTKTQVATLDTFYVTTLAGGSLPFDWVHPRTQAAATFAFVSPPVYTPVGADAWYAALTLEVRP
jgi:hypothetical protein